MLSVDTIERMLKGHTELVLEQAYAKFTENPSPENWDEMSSAMLIYQQWQMAGANHRAEITVAVRNAGIGHWGEIIVKTCCQGRSIEEVMKS